MRYTVRDAELRMLPAAEREQRMAEMMAQTRRAPNGEIKDLESELNEFERVHGYNTHEMRARLTRGTLTETLAICRWAMLADLRDRLLQAHAR